MTKIIATNKNGNLISVSNFFYMSGGLGIQELNEELEKLISDQPFNAHLIKEALNASENVLYDFIVDGTSDDLITLSAVDGLGNTKYLEIKK